MVSAGRTWGDGPRLGGGCFVGGAARRVVGEATGSGGVPHGGAVQPGRALLPCRLAALALFQLFAQAGHDFLPCGRPGVVAGGGMDVGTGDGEQDDRLKRRCGFVLTFQGDLSVRDGHESVERLQLMLQVDAQLWVVVDTKDLKLNVHGDKGRELRTGWCPEAVRWASGMDQGCAATWRTEFSPPNGLGTDWRASGSAIHVPSTTRRYS